MISSSYSATGQDVVIWKEERGSRGQGRLFSSSLYLIPRYYTLTKRPRSNEIIQQCLVALPKRGCLMIYKFLLDKMAGAVSKCQKIFSMVLCMMDQLEDECKIVISLLTPSSEEHGKLVTQTCFLFDYALARLFHCHA